MGETQGPDSYIFALTPNISPSSLIRTAKPVKSLSLVTRQKPSNFRVYNKSMMWMIVDF